jgi:ribosome assembly protein YihI (activator of Der GTPase)
MGSYGNEMRSQRCVIDAPAGIAESGAQLEDYLADSTQRLESIVERLSQGEAVGAESRQWMLDQVDYIVETMGEDTLEISDEMRSNMLQLLLAIANLNEQIRHESSAHQS